MELGLLVFCEVTKIPGSVPTLIDTFILSLSLSEYSSKDALVLGTGNMRGQVCCILGPTTHEGEEMHPSSELYHLPQTLFRASMMDC